MIKLFKMVKRKILLDIQSKGIVSKMDPFHFKNKKCFPSHLKHSTQFILKDKTYSIHKALFDYLDVVNSDKSSELKKIVNIKEQTNSLKINLLDIYKFEFDKNILKLIKKRFTELIDKTIEEVTIRIYFDGGCAKQERLGFFGCSFYINDDPALLISGNIGPENTNNTAEYTGLIISLLFLRIIDINRKIQVKLFSDSELVCKQMIGKYKVNTAHIIILHSIAKNLYKNLDLKSKSIEHILREYNSEADSIANWGKDLITNSFQVFYY
jgi:ribonuclease HI